MTYVTHLGPLQREQQIPSRGHLKQACSVDMQRQRCIIVEALGPITPPVKQASIISKSFMTLRTSEASAPLCLLEVGLGYSAEILQIGLSSSTTLISREADGYKRMTGLPPARRKSTWMVECFLMSKSESVLPPSSYFPAFLVLMPHPFLESTSSGLERHRCLTSEE